MHAHLAYYLVQILAIGLIVGLITFFIGALIGHLFWNKRREGCNDCQKRRIELRTRKDNLEAECRALESQIYDQSGTDFD